VHRTMTITVSMAFAVFCLGSTPSTAQTEGACGAQQDPTLPDKRELIVRSGEKIELDVNNADNEVIVLLNGRMPYHKSSSQDPRLNDKVDLREYLQPGQNILYVVGINSYGATDAAKKATSSGALHETAPIWPIGIVFFPFSAREYSSGTG
jgi:hypothetical protein